MNANLVSAVDLRRLTMGSYEQKIVATRNAITEGAAKHLRVSADKLQIVATYEDQAVVLTGGAFWRLKLEKSDDGQVHVTDSVQETVQAYGLDNVGAFQFAEDAAEAVVDAFLAGRVPEAKERLGQLVRVAPLSTGNAADHAISTLESAFEIRREWRSLFESRKEHFDRFLINALADLATRKLTKKYTKLYDGSFQESELAAYEAIVERDLTLAQARYRHLHQITQAAFVESATAMEKARIAASDVVGLYESFSRDVLSDLDQIVGLAEKATHKVTSVAGRSKIRDTLAENLYQYELASRFVVEVAGRLKQTA